jgi:hypothetical protein
MITKQRIDELYLRKDEVLRQLLDESPDGTLADASQKAFANLDLKKLKADPVLRRFLQQRHVGRYQDEDGVFAPAIKTAWAAEGERLMYMMFLGEPSLGFNFGFEQPDESLESSLESRLHIFFLMMMAVPYLWRKEILQKAESLPVPRHTIPENLLPYTRMYWSWEGCRDTHVTNQNTGERFEMEGDGMLVWYTPPNYIQAGILGSSANEGQNAVHLLPTAALRIGSTWPDDYNEMEQNSLSPLLAKLSFLNSPFVSAERERLPRPIRRALKKTTAADTEPPIHVVKLREASTPNGGAGGTGSEFRHQWWVRGHIRAQWFPSMKGHRLIWIREYLKGPSDAPIIRKIYDVKQ